MRCESYPVIISNHIQIPSNNLVTRYHLKRYIISLPNCKTQDPSHLGKTLSLFTTEEEEGMFTHHFLKSQRKPNPPSLIFRLLLVPRRISYGF